jgi:AbrB family looped-hinge helix DNA binding protein
MKKYTKLSKQGQITIPKAVIKQLGLKVDELVDMEVTDTQIIITKRPASVVTKYIGILKGVTNVTTEQFLEHRKKMR